MLSFPLQSKFLWGSGQQTLELLWYIILEYLAALWNLPMPHTLPCQLRACKMSLSLLNRKVLFTALWWQEEGLGNKCMMDAQIRQHSQNAQICSSARHFPLLSHCLGSIMTRRMGDLRVPLNRIKTKTVPRATHRKKGDRARALLLLVLQATAFPCVIQHMSLCACVFVNVYL